MKMLTALMTAQTPKMTGTLKWTSMLSHLFLILILFRLKWVRVYVSNWMDLFLKRLQMFCNLWMHKASISPFFWMLWVRVILTATHLKLDMHRLVSFWVRNYPQFFNDGSHQRFLDHYMPDSKVQLQPWIILQETVFPQLWRKNQRI